MLHSSPTYTVGIPHIVEASDILSKQAFDN
jgi:hypothetical protein